MRLYGPKLDALPHFLAVHLLTQSVARLLTYLLTDCPQLNPDDAYALPSLREYCITNTTYRRRIFYTLYVILHTRVLHHQHDLQACAVEYTPRPPLAKMPRESSKKRYLARNSVGVGYAAGHAKCNICMIGM